MHKGSSATKIFSVRVLLIIKADSSCSFLYVIQFVIATSGMDAFSKNITGSKDKRIATVFMLNKPAGFLIDQSMLKVES